MSYNQPAFNLNVLPDGYRRRWLSKKKALVILSIIAALCVLFLVYRITCNAMNRTSELQSQVYALNQQAGSRNAEITKQLNMLKTINEFQAISDKRGIITEDLEAIYTTAEESDIQITSISVDEDDTALIACYVSDDLTFYDYRLAFEEFCEALLQTERFTIAEHPPLNFPPVANVTIEVER